MALFILPLTGHEPKNNFALEGWDSTQKTNFKLSRHSLAKSPHSFDDVQAVVAHSKGDKEFSKHISLKQGKSVYRKTKKGIKKGKANTIDKWGVIKAKKNFHPSGKGNSKIGGIATKRSVKAIYYPVGGKIKP